MPSRRSIAGAMVLAAMCVTALPGLASSPISYADAKLAAEHLRSGYDPILRKLGDESEFVPYGSHKRFGSPLPCDARAGCYPIDSCAFPDLFLPNAGNSADKSAARSERYAIIADTVVSFRRGLTSLGYPAAPANARIFLIPSFFYEVCRAQRLDPESMSACDHWREVLDGHAEDVSDNQNRGTPIVLSKP